MGTGYRMKKEKLDFIGIFIIRNIFSVVIIVIMMIVMYMVGYTRGHRIGWDDHREAIKPSYLKWSE